MRRDKSYAKTAVDVGEDARRVMCVHQGAGPAESCFNRRALRHYVHLECLRADHLQHGMMEA